MTNTELKDQIDSEITDAVANNSVSPTIVGGNMKDVVDYVDQQIGLILKTKISQSGTSAPTLDTKFNTTGLTWTASRTGVGVYRFTPSSLISTDVNFKLFFNSSSYDVPNYKVDNLGIFFDVTIKHWTGSNFSSSDDVINGAIIELEIF